MSKLPSRKYLLSHLNRNGHNDKIWENISSMGDIDVEFVREFKDRLDWHKLNWNHSLKFDMAFITEFEDYIDWESVSMFTYLDEDVVRKYAHKLNMKKYVQWFSLSEELLERYADQIDWGYVSFKQKMSDKFIKKHRDRLGIDFLGLNPFIPKKLQNLLEKLRKEGKFENSQYYDGHTQHMKERYAKAVEVFNTLPELDEYFAKVK